MPKNIKWLEKKATLFFEYISKRMFLAVIVFFFGSLLFRIAFIDFGSLLREDEFVYFLKALEIIKGNFIPAQTHGIGLSLAIAPVFYFLRLETIFDYMPVAKVFNALIGSLAIVPFYLIVKKIVASIRVQFVALFLFCFYPALIVSSTLFYSEPLFLFLFLWTVYFVLLSKQKQYYILFAFLFAALSYIVRPNGIFLLPVVVFPFLLFHSAGIKKTLLRLFLGALLFFIFVFPFLLARYNAFGSAFSYGENDKYFASDYWFVWSENIDVPSFGQFFAANHIGGVFDKFIFGGIGKLSMDFFFQKGVFKHSPLISPLLIIFFLLGLVITVRKKSFFTVYLSMVAFFLGTAIIYDVFGTPRHVLVLVPFIILISSVGLIWVLKHLPYQNSIVALFLFVCAFFFLITPASIRLYGNRPFLISPRAGTQMSSIAVWAAQNIQGTIAIVEGGDLIMMNLPDAVIGGVGMYTMYAPQSNIRIMRPGYFSNMTQALQYFKEKNVSYIAVSQDAIIHRPYLSEVYSPQNVGIFLQAASNRYTLEPNPIDIFQIRWENVQ